MSAKFSRRRIDDEVYLAVFDSIHNVRTTLMPFQNGFHLNAPLLKKGRSAIRGQQLEAGFLKTPGGVRKFLGAVTLGNGEQHGTFHGQRSFRGFLRLVERQPERRINAQHFPCGTHFRPEHRVDLREHIEREHRFFDPEMRNVMMFQIEVSELLAKHNFGGNARHGNPAYLGNQRHGTRCAWVGFEHVDHILADRILNIHQPHHAHFARDGAGVLIDGLDVLLRNTHGWNHTGGIA